MANSVGPDQTAPNAVCNELFVPNCIITSAVNASTKSDATVYRITTKYFTPCSFL